MSIPRLSDEMAHEAVDAYRANGNNKQKAADALGLKISTYKSRLDIAARRGFLGPAVALPGFEIKSVATKEGDAWVRQVREPGEVFEVPPGHQAKGYSALVDGEGRVIQQWVKTAAERSVIDVASVLKEAFKDYQPAAPRTVLLEHGDANLLNLIPCADWHLGLLVWHRETGTDWDLNRAEQEIGDGIEDAIMRSPRAGTAIVLGGGDGTHADNNSNVTERSKHKLDVDGRHQKIMEVAGRLKVRTIDAALRHNDEVIVRELKGNHDPETAPAIAWFLSAWYRNEPRVTVDLDQSLFFYHPHGQVMLAATHGHEVKLKDMPQIMAHRRPEMWGATRFRYAHGFHVHHQSKSATEGGGVIMESHQAPIPQDAWHYGAGFLSSRSLQTITYHRAFGEVSRVRVAMLDHAA